MYLATANQASTTESIDTSAPSLDQRNKLISDGFWLVRALAAELLQLHGFSIAREDLESCGMRGLIRAAECFDPSRGARFTTFAYHRIRGVMLDAIRDGHGQCTRTEMARMVRDARGRRSVEASGSESDGTDVDRNDLENLTLHVNDWDGWQLDVERSVEPAATPEDLVDRNLAAARVRAAIRRLPARAREVVELLYYQHEGSYEAVAKSLGVTRPYVFRVHARAVARLRKALRVRRSCALTRLAVPPSRERTRS